MTTTAPDPAKDVDRVAPRDALVAEPRSRRVAGPVARIGGTGAIRLGTLVVVLAVQLVAAWPARGPVWSDDEVGPLATARLLAGVGEPLELAHSSYYPLWAVVLTPVWWVTQDPAAVYRIGVALSVLCATLLVLPMAALARRVGASPRLALVVAGIVAVAPGRVMNSGYVLIENFLVLVLAMTAVATVRYAERPTWQRAALLGLGAAATFTAHGRMILVAGVTALGFALELRRRPRSAGVGLLVVVAGSAAGFALHRTLASALYPDGGGREEAALQAATSTGPISLVQALLGQVWYAAVPWLALPLIGIWLCARVAGRELRIRRPGAGCWAVAVTAGVAAVSVTVVSNAVHRGSGRVDVLAYGRYVEPVLVLLALLGLTVLARRARPPRRPLFVIAAITAGAAAVFLAWSALGSDPQGWWAPINVAQLTAFRLDGTLRGAWLIASVVGVIASVGYLLVRRILKARRAVVGAVGALFLAGSVFAQVQVSWEWRSGWGAAPPMTTLVRQLGISEVAFDVAESESTSQNLAAYWLADLTVETFDSETQPPPHAAVLAPPGWTAAEKLGASLVGSAGRHDALWVLPGPLADELAAEGAFDTPTSGVAGSVERIDGGGASLPAHRARVTLRLTNTGTSWWRPTTPQTPGATVMMWWTTSSGLDARTVSLPGTVPPGESVDVTVRLRPPADARGVPVRVVLADAGPPGDTELGTLAFAG